MAMQPTEMETVESKKGNTYQRRVIHVGDIFYVNGYASSKVEVVLITTNNNKVLCKYLTAPTYRPEKLGKNLWITRGNLYPYGGR